jgi:hypothetical protein
MQSLREIVVPSLTFPYLSLSKTEEFVENGLNVCNLNEIRIQHMIIAIWLSYITINLVGGGGEVVIISNKHDTKFIHRNYYQFYLFCNYTSQESIQIWRTLIWFKCAEIFLLWFACVSNRYINIARCYFHLFTDTFLVNWLIVFQDFTLQLQKPSQNCCVLK